jgi:hypothetical protein
MESEPVKREAAYAEILGTLCVLVDNCLEAKRSVWKIVVFNGRASCLSVRCWS